MKPLTRKWWRWAVWHNRIYAPMTYWSLDRWLILATFVVVVLK